MENMHIDLKVWRVNATSAVVSSSSLKNADTMIQPNLKPDLSKTESSKKWD